jgi:RHS repeat-associated protein
MRLVFEQYERDPETNLDFAQARYYASVQGRFTSVDPLMASASVKEPQSWNRYAFVQNNPCKFIDPTGMKELSAEDCQKDSRCVSIKINVIYDSNANKGHGITDKQKAKFEKEQLQKVKDEYGEAFVHFEVTYAEKGGFDGKQITGVQSDALNVLVTTQNLGGADAASQVRNGMAVTGINIARADEGVLGHEFAHHFLGHTRNSIGRAMGEYGGLVGNMFANLYGEAEVGQARTSLAIFGPYYGTYPNALQPGQRLPITTPFHEGARSIQQFLLTQKANRPQQ